MARPGRGPGRWPPARDRRPENRVPIMSTAVATRIDLRHAADTEYEIERAMLAALPDDETGAWQSMHNQVRPVDAARNITGGRIGARIFLD
jgi:hypothetical protein